MAMHIVRGAVIFDYKKHRCDEIVQRNCLKYSLSLDKLYIPYDTSCVQTSDLTRRRGRPCTRRVNWIRVPRVLFLLRSSRCVLRNKNESTRLPLLYAITYESESEHRQGGPLSCHNVKSRVVQGTHDCNPDGKLWSDRYPRVLARVLQEAALVRDFLRGSLM
jgi:hypothetical protein